MEYKILANGVKIPMIGYGIYKIVDEQECEKCILDAIDVGYRLLDTAQSYGNERFIGNAVKKSNVPRSELFITTKIKTANQGYEKAKASIEESLENLQTDYIDLMLIHQPYGDYYGSYRAMTEFYKAGKIRALGVSNFYPDRLIDLYSFSEIKPVVNQVETHIFNQQKVAHEYMEKYNIAHEAWAPFAEGRNDFFTHPVLNEIGKKHNKTAAQIALRYLLQSDIIAIPKTVNRGRMEQNISIFDFALDEVDLKKLSAADECATVFYNHHSPEMAERFTSFARQ
ncbi:MAG: aldo/keto reductase [Ruminococcaceae bacterium]|nr:aldo/keto reductase [Oscillospiraceae bacterium]